MQNHNKHSSKTHFVGVVMMCFGVACLGIHDATAKQLTASYHPLQILFLRNALALPAALFLALHFQGLSALRSSRPAVHILRGFLWVLATVAFFTSFKSIGLAQSTALLSTAPLFVVAIAATFLLEPTGWKRWASVILGFVGVLVIVQPGSGTLQFGILMPILAALIVALLMLSARLLDERESVWTLLLYLTGSSTLVSAFAAPFFWQPVSYTDIWMLLSISFFGTLGTFLITQAFRIAPANVLAPFDYTALIWATLLDWMFWDEIPCVLTVTGAAIIVASGILPIVLNDRAIRTSRKHLKRR